MLPANFAYLTGEPEASPCACYRMQLFQVVSLMRLVMFREGNVKSVVSFIK
jgi:hypothetical protein